MYSLKLSQFERFKEKKFQNALVYTLSNLISPAVGILLGPLILKKIGLANYGILALAIYFMTLATIYSDFGGYSHLLISYSKKIINRNVEFANAVFLKILILILIFILLSCYSVLHKRSDGFYYLLSIYLVGILPSPSNFDWYFIANKNYLVLFYGRIFLNILQVSLILFWFYSNSTNYFLIPVIAFGSSLFCSLYYLSSIGNRDKTNILSFFRLFSFHEVRKLFIKLLPVAATQLVAPYTLPYALVWFSISTNDQKMVGIFSIVYRIVLGFMSLVGPFVFFTVAGKGNENSKLNYLKIFKYSIISTLVFWLLGIPILVWYFWWAHFDKTLYYFAISTYSVLLIGIFSISLRTVLVSEILLKGRYFFYFSVHFFCTAPILIFSWLTIGKLNLQLIPWLACLPDIMITSLFLIYSTSRKHAIS